MLEAAANLDLVFHALSDGTRRSLLRRLSDGEKTVGELAADYDVSLNAISKHLKVLTEADLVIRRKSGRQQILNLNPQSFGAVREWLQLYESFWRERLDALADYLAEDSGA
ncbi:MAG: ArsR family transcriptional regulator [Bradyrhizobium sp.]|nr:MAG: ArsR family transcriptional regulator [Bradyrhizobium sp.]